jgi:uncharacterized protein (TIGR03118 family)
MYALVLRGAFVALALSLTLAAATPSQAAPPGGVYTVTPLVSDVLGAAKNVDPNLVNGWGLARSDTSPWWVSDNGKKKSSVYTGDGTVLTLAPTVDGGPTGAVFAGILGNFLVGTTADPSTLLPASFVFASEDGKIRAWRGGSAAALVTADLNDGAIYKGLAIAQTSAGPRLYAADFHNAKVDVFDGGWNDVTPAGSFVDPGLPDGYAPFGIQTIGGRIFVGYAKQDENAEDEVAGQGRGFVDAYDLAGNLVGRVVGHGQLDAPWGLALAPAGFGRFAGDLLVGNFGDGQINAYAESSPGVFAHRGTLRTAGGKKLVIDGLWALEFGNGTIGTPQTLLFTAGPNDESHGLFGAITATKGGR